MWYNFSMSKERFFEVWRSLLEWTGLLPLIPFSAILAWFLGLGPEIIVVTALSILICAFTAYKRAEKWWQWLAALAIGILPFVALEVTNSYLEYRRKVIISDVFRVPEPPDLKLGESSGEPHEIRDVLTYSHERALVLWDASYLYVLTPDLRIARRESDADYGMPGKYEKLETLISRFKPPEGRLPPFYGVARHWDADEKNWEWIGWLNWFCSYANGGVYVQRYQNGIAIGPFAPAPSSSKRLVYFLNTEDNKWRSTYTSVPSVDPDRCVP